MTIKMGQDDLYQTRNGLPVRIIATDYKSVWPVVAIVVNGHNEYIVIRRADGTLHSPDAPTSEDIIQKPRRFKKNYWVNIYRDARSVLHTSRQEANREAVSLRIACLPITFEGTEGEGL